MQLDHLRRREFITLLGGAAAAWPFVAMAQEAGRAYRLGFVSAAPRDEAWYTAFFEELRGIGFVEGQISRSFRADLAFATNY
jgi:putative ABC transport system substrate-binding protein